MRIAEMMKTLFLLILYCIGFQPTVLPAGEHNAIMQGVDPQSEVKAEKKGKYVCYTGEKVSSYYEYPTDGTGFVEWRTPVIDKLPEGESITFTVPCGFGISKGFLAEHELLIDQKPAVVISPPQKITQEWSGNGVKVVFHALRVDDCYDVFGLMFVSVPKDRIVPGKYLTLTMNGRKCGSESWFMLSSISVASDLDIAGIQKKNLVAEKLEKQAKPVVPDKAESLTRICKWRGGKCAALSFATDDGHVSVIKAFHPILTEYGYPGTSYVITGRVQGSKVSRASAINKYSRYFKTPLAGEWEKAKAGKSTKENFWERLFLVHFLKFPDGTPKSEIRLQNFNAVTDDDKVTGERLSQLDQLFREAVGVYCPPEENQIPPEKWLREGDNRPTNWDDWRDVVKAGHAVASHTVSHGFTGFLPPELMEFEIMESKREIEAQIPGYACNAIALPCGNCTKPLAELVGSRFVYERSGTVLPYVKIPEYDNTTRAGRLSMGYGKQAKAFPAYADDAVESAITAGVWLPEVYHTFKDEDGAGNIRPAHFRQHLDYIKARGFFLWVALGEDIFKYTRQRLHSELKVVRAEKSISVSLTDDLDNAIYNQPLTVQVEVPPGSMLVDCFIDGKVIPCEYVIENGMKAVRFEMLIDGKAVEIRHD
jgi:peptidoglycan/xylan/chitin deacetylase (PgdA/CDA1 family)